MGIQGEKETQRALIYTESREKAQRASICIELRQKAERASICMGRDKSSRDFDIYGILLRYLWHRDPLVGSPSIFSLIRLI